MNRFRAQNIPHRALCARVAGEHGELRVADDLAARDHADGRRNGVLEGRRVVEVDRDVVEGDADAGEEGAEAGGELVRVEAGSAGRPARGRRQGVSHASRPHGYGAGRRACGPSGACAGSRARGRDRVRAGSDPPRARTRARGPTPPTSTALHAPSGYRVARQPRAPTVETPREHPARRRRPITRERGQPRRLESPS